MGTMKYFISVIYWTTSFLLSASEAMLTTSSVQFLNQKIEFPLELSQKSPLNPSFEIGLSKTFDEANDISVKKTREIIQNARTSSSDEQNNDNGFSTTSEQSVTSASLIPISKETAFLEPIVVAPTLTADERPVPVSISIFGEIIQPGLKDNEINNSAESEDVEIEMDTLQFYPAGKSVTFYVLFAFGACALLLQIVLLQMSSKVTYKYNAKCV